MPFAYVIAEKKKKANQMYKAGVTATPINQTYGNGSPPSDSDDPEHLYTKVQRPSRPQVLPVPTEPLANTGYDPSKRDSPGYADLGIRHINNSYPGLNVDVSTESLPAVVDSYPRPRYYPGPEPRPQPRAAPGYANIPADYPYERRLETAPGASFV